MWESSLHNLLLCGSQYVVHVAHVCRTRSATGESFIDFIERPGGLELRS